MGKKGITQYFEDKRKKNMSPYIERLNHIYAINNMKILSGAVTAIALWDMFMMANHLAGNKDTGCATETYLLTLKTNDLKYDVLITTLHDSRNKIAHIADDIEVSVNKIISILKKYKYYDVLQKDLDMIFKGTNLTVSAKRLFEIYDVKLQRKYNDTEDGAQKSSITDKLQDELQDIVDEFKG